MMYYLGIMYILIGIWFVLRNPTELDKKGDING